jgi:trigger factor
MSTSTLTRLAPTQVELEISLAPDEIEAAQQRAFARLSRNVRLPGFRKGKVPRRLFEQTYGTYEIESEAFEDLAPVAYARAVREHDLDPVDRPKLELLPKEEGKPARLRATVEVRPEIALGEYKGIEVKAPAIAIEDGDVERAMESLARERATLVPVERPARLGDAVTIDYEGRIDGEIFEGGSAQRQQTQLEEDRFIPGFASGIAGMSANETKAVAATFPDDYPKHEYAGKTAEFTVTLHEVKEVDVPPLDDEFAKSVSEAQTLDELRGEVRKRLEGIAQGRRRRYVGNAVMEELLKRIEVPAPAGLIERETEQMMTDAQQRAERAGISFDEYLEQSGTTREQLQQRFREDAATQVKGTLVLEAIAKAEGLEASAADVRAEIEALARSYGQPVERMRQAVGLDNAPLKEGIVRGKAMDLLIESAKVTEEAEKGSTAV